MIELTVFGLMVLCFGVSFASFFVAKFVYLPLKNASDHPEDFVLDHEFHYLDEIDAIKNKKLKEETLLSLRKKYAIDETPNGKVVVSYDHNDKWFLYWSQCKEIPYKTLDTVARKFCVENDCKCIYLDVYEELYKQHVKDHEIYKTRAMSPTLLSDDEYGELGASPSSSIIYQLDGDEKEQAQQMKEEDEEQAQQMKEQAKRIEDEEKHPLLPLKQSTSETPLSANAVFASFKKYNKKPKLITNDDELEESKIKNTFKYAGKITEWEDVFSQEQNESQEKRKDFSLPSSFSYQEFKKLLSSQKTSSEIEMQPVPSEIEMQPLPSKIAMQPMSSNYHAKTD